MARNRAGFEVAKEEEAEKMTGAGGRGSEGDEVAAAAKERLEWRRGEGETKDGNREPT